MASLSAGAEEEPIARIDNILDVDVQYTPELGVGAAPVSRTWHAQEFQDYRYIYGFPRVSGSEVG